MDLVVTPLLEPAGNPSRIPPECDETSADFSYTSALPCLYRHALQCPELIVTSKAAFWWVTTGEQWAPPVAAQIKFNTLQRVIYHMATSRGGSILKHIPVWRKTFYRAKCVATICGTLWPTNALRKAGDAKEIGQNMPAILFSTPWIDPVSLIRGLRKTGYTFGYYLGSRNSEILFSGIQLQLQMSNLSTRAAKYNSCRSAKSSCHGHCFPMIDPSH